MNSSQLLGITTFIYLASAVLYLVIFIFRARKLGRVATVVTVIGFLVQTVGIGLRWHESQQLGYGHAPLSNMYESLVFFSWCTIAIYLFFEWRFKNRLVGAFATPFACVSMAYATTAKGLGQRITPLVPALQSNWLLAHVITCFIGYASFAVACGMGVMYLLKARQPQNPGDGSRLSSLPELRVIDDLIYKAMVFGFLWLSAGIISGAVWANSAWGSYWSWDPKETWSLITWFVYAATLHARFVRGWSGKRIAWLAIIGFCSVIFTYFGVNYLLSGLHSYGRVS